MTFAVRNHRAISWPINFVGGTFSFDSPTGTAYCGYKIDTDGDEYKVEDITFPFTWTSINTWLLGGSASDYWVYCTFTGDTPLGSATSTWIQLTADVNWYLAQPTVGSKTAALTILVARSSGGPTLATVNVSLYAERT